VLGESLPEMSAKGGPTENESGEKPVFYGPIVAGLSEDLSIFSRQVGDRQKIAFRWLFRKERRPNGCRHFAYSIAVCVLFYPFSAILCRRRIKRQIFWMPFTASIDPHRHKKRLIRRL
jgi:hypothetical protein